MLLTRALAAATAVLVLLPQAAVAATDLTVKDPGGDTESLATVSQEQRRTTDLRVVRYDGDADLLVIRARYNDLSDDVPGNQFLDTRFADGDSYLVASTELGTKVVMVFDGTHYYECEGSRAKADLDAETVKQRIPTECLAGFESSTAATVSVLARNNGSPLVRDDVEPISVSLD